MKNLSINTSNCNVSIYYVKNLIFNINKVIGNISGNYKVDSNNYNCVLNNCCLNLIKNKGKVILEKE
jgi:hypothetical protein